MARGRERRPWGKRERDTERGERIERDTEREERAWGEKREHVRGEIKCRGEDRELVWRNE